MTGDARASGSGIPGVPHPAAAAGEEVRQARRALKPPGDVHEARKHLKRARALVRLCETGERGDEAAELRHGIRDAGRELATLRDRDAVREALHELDGERRIPPSVLATLRARAAHDPEGDRATPERVRRDLRRAGRRLPSLAEATGPAEWLAELGRSYRKARRAYRAAVAHPTGEALHTLRKRAKDLRYQVEWLAPVWPGVLTAWVAELHALTDELGRTQDVRVVRRQVGDGASAGERRRVALILWDLRRDGRRARRAALDRGRKLFAEAPDSFTRRMAALAEG